MKHRTIQDSISIKPLSSIKLITFSFAIPPFAKFLFIYLYYITAFPLLQELFTIFSILKPIYRHIPPSDRIIRAKPWKMQKSAI